MNPYKNNPLEESDAEECPKCGHCCEFERNIDEENGCYGAGGEWVCTNEFCEVDSQNE